MRKNKKAIKKGTREMKEYIAPALIVVIGIVATYFLCNIIPDGVKCIDGKIYSWQGSNVYKPSDTPCVVAK